jgi:HK97 family phage portal protein
MTTPSGLVVRSSSFDEVPNDNDPASHPPATVGPPAAVPGDPNGVVFLEEGTPSHRSVRFVPSAWSGWPAEWETPNWQGHVQLLTDTAWACLDSNTSVLSTMPPYLVGAAASLGADWLNNPDPDVYQSWEEFAKQLFWDYQGLGEAFVMATAWYATGWPARFHVVPPWMVDADIDGAGLRRYQIGQVDVTDSMLHVRYTSRVGDAHGHGPLEVAGPRLVAAAALARYARTIAASPIPHSVLTHPQRLTAEQSAALQAQWVEARMSTLGMPAVLSGGLDFKTIQYSPTELSLVELSQWNEARIAVLLRVPPVCVALPSGGDPMTYSNVNSLFDYRWRDGLRPMAQAVMAALSWWALPRGTTVELNRDEYVRPAPLERAQTDDIWIRNGVYGPEEVRVRERVVLTAEPPALEPPAPPEPEGVLQ